MLVPPLPSWVRFLARDYSYDNLDKRFNFIESEFKFCYTQNLTLIDAINTICEHIDKDGDKELAKLKERLKASKKELEARLYPPLYLD